MTQALYYPWIDIKDESWLKTSLLYWDSMRTIVPESIDSPYSTDTGFALYDAGFLVPLRVNSDMAEVQELTDDVKKYINTKEAGKLLVTEGRTRRQLIHLDKLATNLTRLPMYSHKLGHEALRFLGSRSKKENLHSDWIDIDEGFAHFYMTLLANRLAERIGASLLTPFPEAENMALEARLDTHFEDIPSRVDIDLPTMRRNREYDATGSRRLMPKALAAGMLAQLAIQRISLAPDTPVHRILEFREQHNDELALFRSKVSQLSSAIENDMPIEAFRQRVLDIHQNEVAPAISNLKAALDSRRIKWISEGLLKISFLSAGSSSVLITTGLSVPTALLAGAGLSLIVSATTYNADKQDSLRNNPFSYLLSIERELS